MSILDNYTAKSIEVANDIDDTEKDVINRKTPVIAVLAARIVNNQKNSQDEFLTPKDYLCLYTEVSNALKNIASRKFPNKIQQEDLQDQLDSALEDFIAEITDEESDTALVRAIKSNLLLYQPFDSENPSECFNKINSYIYKRLFTLLKKYATDKDLDYISLNGSVKNYLTTLVKKKTIEKYNSGYKLPGQKISNLLNSQNPGKNILTGIDFERRYVNNKAVNYRLAENIDKIISQMQDTYFEARDITELLYSKVYRLSIVSDSSIIIDEDNEISLIDNIASNALSPEELAIEKMADEEPLDLDSAISEIEMILDNDCKQINQIQKNKTKYRMIQLGYLASQQYFDCDAIKKIHKEHLELLTPTHPDYANRIMNFLNIFVTKDSYKIKAGLSGIKAYVKNYNNAFEAVTSDMTLKNQLSVKTEYASRLVNHYFELLGETNK